MRGRVKFILRILIQRLARSARLRQLVKRHLAQFPRVRAHISSLVSESHNELALVDQSTAILQLQNGDAVCNERVKMILADIDREAQLQAGARILEY